MSLSRHAIDARSGQARWLTCIHGLMAAGFETCSAGSAGYLSQPRKVAWPPALGRRWGESPSPSPTAKPLGNLPESNRKACGVQLARDLRGLSCARRRDGDSVVSVRHIDWGETAMFLPKRSMIACVALSTILLAARGLAATCA